MGKIDDYQLLRLLEKNARITFTELAEVLGVTETAIRKKMRKLEEEGYILQYKAILDLRKLGFQIHALIGVDVNPELYIKVIETLKQDERLDEVHISSGDHMIMIRAWFKTHEELSQYTKELEAMPGVTKVCPAVLRERVK